VTQYQKGETNLDFTEARDSEWQWHQLGRMQVCNSLQTDNHTSTAPLSFLQAGCPSCRPTNSVKALKAKETTLSIIWQSLFKQPSKFFFLGKTFRCCDLTYGGHRKLASRKPEEKYKSKLKQSKKGN